MSQPGSAARERGIAQKMTDAVAAEYAKVTEQAAQRPRGAAAVGIIALR